MLLRDERLQDDVRANRAGLTGELRITTTPIWLCAGELVPLLAEFSQLREPSRAACLVSLHADLITERFDVAIRLGTLADSRYHAALMTLLHHPARGNARLAGKPSVNSLGQLAEADWIIHERLTSPLWQVRRR